MGKHSKLTTEEIIEMSGFSLVSVEGGYYNMTCSKGHKVQYSGTCIRGTGARCNICSGKGLDLPEARKELAKYGYTLVAAKTSLDRSGNEVLKATQRITVRCQQGHETSTFCMSDIRAGRTCTYCSGSVRNSGYSRGEEIIAKVLELNDIAYTRQYPIVVTTDEGTQTLKLDFFLPTLNTIIEYDGGHHKYGRSDGTVEDLFLIQERDSLRDQYAQDNNINMVRIAGDHIYGKAIVFSLFEALGNCIDLYLGVTYDKEIKAIFDYSAISFNWNDYEYYRNIASLRLTGMELTDIQRLHGFRSTRVNKSFRTVYGVSYREYRGGKYSEFINQ